MSIVYIEHEDQKASLITILLPYKNKSHDSAGEVITLCGGKCRGKRLLQYFTSHFFSEIKLNEM
jgi:hypothetical protein